MRQNEEHLSQIFKGSFDSFLKECFNKLRIQFEMQYGDKCNRLYFYWFLSLLYENISCRFIYGHLFLCKRNGAISSECKFCCQVIRNYILDETETFFFLRYRGDYLDHFEEVCASQKYFSVQLNKEHYRCSYLENVSTSNQLVCIFGVVAARIFLNVAKKKFFIGHMENYNFYRYYARWTKKLFEFCCDNIKLEYAHEAICYLKPFEHYQATNFKVCNLNYVYYLENLK